MRVNLTDMRVNLTYFKDTGKYYSEGKLEVPRVLPTDVGGLHAGSITPLFEIWAVVRHLQCEQQLPGLSEGHGNFTVLVEVPAHPHNHPHLVIPDRFPSRDLNIPFTKLEFGLNIPFTKLRG